MCWSYRDWSNAGSQHVSVLIGAIHVAYGLGLIMWPFCWLNLSSTTNHALIVAVVLQVLFCTFMAFLVQRQRPRGRAHRIYWLIVVPWVALSFVVKIGWEWTDLMRDWTGLSIALLLWWFAFRIAVPSRSPPVEIESALKMRNVKRRRR